MRLKRFFRREVRKMSGKVGPDDLQGFEICPRQTRSRRQESGAFRGVCVERREAGRDVTTLPLLKAEFLFRGPQIQVFLLTFSRNFNLGGCYESSGKCPDLSACLKAPNEMQLHHCLSGGSLHPKLTCLFSMNKSKRKKLFK